MENMTEIALNQLPLFADMLTVEQEQRVVAAKADATKQMNCQRVEVIRKAAIVEAAGFLPTQYGYSTDCKKLTRSINASKWSEESKYVELELDQFNGNFYIIFDKYDKTKNEIVKHKSQVYLQGDKMECYGLNQNSRMMKPTTILANIAKAAKKAAFDFERANTVKSTVEYTVNKYKKLYPNAEVEAGKGYNRGRGNYEEFNTVTVKFKSGSYIVFRITSQPDAEYVHEKYDVVTAKMLNTELMDYFNAQ